ncbi:hypothetical protein CAPTEDRAFT_167067 [Capitella teleta]|uniref:Dehydrogenase/reductase SDR family member 7 n=1 Tax=Capitella teleta TaxID=283909 RepID=R7U3F3_CAPTE|nr:hypothetical protein CAPTEDRAFT_167067 [Capitella teleta]|eukprot:ELU00489.1 hypothetical protein CAPTEDRAFT_167067 [Capitella teleta]
MSCCWCDVLLYAFVAFIVVQLIRLIFADADLSLLWKEKFGKKADSLKGQVVWITGCSSGIGEYLAYELAKAGCRLILSARRIEELERVKKQCLIYGPISDEDILVAPLDVADVSSHEGAVEAVINHFGQVDVLVNNAGRSQRAMICDTSIEVDREMIDINVVGQISLTKTVLPHMRKRKSGHIVVTSSLAGKMGVPFSATYCLTKFALHGWFDSLRIESCSDDIKVTMICPGPVFSDITKHCFTGQKGQLLNQAMKSNEKRVTTQRCAELMAAGIANQVEEVWIALQPVLLLAYLTQYFPSIMKWLACRLGVKTLMKVREGRN